MSNTPTTSEPRQVTDVCVFCGANPGKGAKFLTTAKSLAHVLHANSWSLVYGGGTVGLMGAIASELISLGGSVHGFIPEALISKEQEGRVPIEARYGKTTIVPDMHKRKELMAKASQAFVAMPGGFGTMDELFEIITWNQLGIHDCPVVLLNIDGYYDGLMQWINTAIEHGLISEGNRGIVVEAKTVEEVAAKIKNYKVATGRYDLNWNAQSR
ncbi:hypothetical protein BDZ91DRAFT_481344 [Kalaharituber pfeilii]|nr:hypothetical protein BDZ91DRAFT_481344 [Kalaharituber pfeilii]